MRWALLLLMVVITVYAYAPFVASAIVDEAPTGNSITDDIANLPPPQSYFDTSATNTIANLVVQIGGSSADNAVFDVIERELATITKDLTTIIAQDEVSIEALVEQATKLAKLSLRLQVAMLQRELREASNELGLSDGWVDELLRNN